MSGWDVGRVYHADLLRNEPAAESDETLNVRCSRFFGEFCLQQHYVYREIIASNVSQGMFHVTVDLLHLQAFDEDLLSMFMSNPQRIVPALESAAQALARQFWTPSQVGSLRDPFSDFQVRFQASQLQSSTMSIRDLDSSQVGRFVRIPGIVVSTGTVVNRPVLLALQCRQCEHSEFINVNPTSASGPIAIPATCGRRTGNDVNDDKCPRDSYAIVPERCQCVDQQSIKLQEAHDAVPVGELPRHVLILADRSLANSVSAGTRVIVNGIFNVFSSPDRKATAGGGAPALRTPFIKVLGFETVQGGSSHSLAQYNESDEKRILELVQRPNFLQSFAHSIAPSIFGCEDVKRALACLLVGGTTRLLPDRVRLRGDINVLLLGDPGMAKSQFLKFVERVAPVSVYTSGKGSSAAGLTASVIRDARTGDFYLEGGAMVLADGGVCCIDEFDKMNDEDRVAIHEAMEQQTISIAKAGITTVLNSRTSVLAAANPVFGRYDDLKNVGENIDFGSTILSRFDLIFVMRDEHNIQKDINMARHVIGIHQNAANAREDQLAEGEIDVATMKKLIAYCRQKCFPRLTPSAAEKLAAHYVNIRSRVQEMEAANAERSSIPITVRQLEAIVRVSEALAKLTLSSVATEAHVDEALRLFRVSTMQAVLAGHSLEGMTRPDLIKQVDAVERAICQRLSVGARSDVQTLIRELTQSKGFSEPTVVKTLDMMVQQERLMLRQQRKQVIRIR